MKYLLKSGTKTVTTAGTRVALATTNIWARGLRISAPAANAGAVYIGDNTVAASNGYQLSAGAFVSLADLFNENNDSYVLNLSNIYVDAATNADKITFVYLEPAS